MVSYCSNCGTKIIEGAQFCSYCGKSTKDNTITKDVMGPSAPTIVKQPIQNSPQSAIWYQDNYRMRKKVLTLWNKYWIEDKKGKVLGFTKQKMFKLKEDIRIYTDENMTEELFQIKQEQIFDAWGKFGVYDTTTNQRLGYIRRNFLHSHFAKDTWEIFTNNDIQIGKISETSTGRALARKYLPGGGLVPEQMTLELNGQAVATVNQEFKIIGDIWNVNCHSVPPNFDRRVIIATCILMANLERDRK
jgi:uncharacterized protein YxjI